MLTGMVARSQGSYAVVLAAVAMVVGVEAQAADADLSTAVTGQPVVHRGDTVTYLVNYANEGPDTATSAYVNLFIPSGIPVPLSELTQDDFDDLEASAQGTDTLGNTPMLFFESNYCESLQFQVQGPVPPNPV